jgi:hypothetical protein
VQLHQRLKQGDIVLTLLPRSKDEALAVARACREHGIRLVFSEMLFRGSEDFGWPWRRQVPRSEFLSRQDLDEVIDTAGEFYYGRVCVGEIGGVLYWPKAYTIGRRAENWCNLPPCRDHAEAEAAYVAYCRHWLDVERAQVGKGLLMDVDSSILFKYHAMAGIDILCLEVMPGDPHLMHAAIRGAARAYGLPWGSHIAMQCYGGMCLDGLYQKRWRTSLFFSFIAGADFIYPESGHYTYANEARGQQFGFASPEMKRVRRAIREVWQFARVHTRPASGPRTPIGVVHGLHDGAPGLWNRYAWGQYHDPAWLEGPAERGWSLVDAFHRRDEWHRETVQGDENTSGNPPCGQYDAVPVEAPLDVLRRYSCLLFLGWNTMTAETYGKLKRYVAGGGHLLMWLPQLSTRTDRTAPMTLFREGDFADLFGCRVRGRLPTDVRGIKCLRDSVLPAWRFPLWRIRTDPRFLGNLTPVESVELTTGQVISGHSDFYDTTAEELNRNAVLIENRLGKGVAYLVALWEYPADEGVRRFADDLLRVVLQGEQDALRVLSHDRLRYAVYEGRTSREATPYSVVYLLNTDPDVPAITQFSLGGRRTPHFTVAPGELRLAYRFGDCILVPEDKCVDLRSAVVERHRVTVRLAAVAGQIVLACNLGETALSLSLNGRSVRVPPGAEIAVRLSRRVDPKRQEFFAADFLEEPEVDWREAGLPY